MNIHKINLWFERRANGILKRRWLYLFLFAALLLAGANGLQYMNTSTSWDDYFLEGDPILVKTEEFKEVFGNDNFVAILTRCENTFTQKNLQLIRELSQELMDSLSYADKVTSLTDIEYMHGTEWGMEIQQIVPEIIPVDQASLDSIRQKAYSKPQLAERLISKDGTLSWIIVKLRPFPEASEWKKDRTSKSPEMLTGEEAYKVYMQDKYSALNPLGSGMPLISYRKMEWFGREGSKTMGLAILIAILIMGLTTRSLKGTIVPIITAISSVVIVYGVLGYIRYKIDSSMMTIPMILAFAISIAYNIHVFSYFKRQFRSHGKRKEAVKEAITEMGWPILFSGLTTLTALLSFLVIPVVPIHFIGIATASSVLVTLFTVLFIMPIILSFGKDKQAQVQQQKRKEGRLDKLLLSLADGVMQKGKPILWISTLLAIVLIYGATKIETAFDVEHTMGRKIQYVDELLTVTHSELGSMYSYDVLIDFPEEGMAKDPKQLGRLDQLSAYVNGFELTKRSSSVLDILKDLNQTLNENKEEYYAIPKESEQVAQLLLLYENAGGSEAEYWMDYEYKRLRLMVELENYNSQRAEDDLAELSAFAQDLFPDAQVTTVGSLPQFTAMMQYVVRGQIKSFGIALIMITLLLMLVFGSVRIGLIGIIPNIAPAITVGGIMGWFGIPLDMMTATIIPMILGLAVDDTIHFINHGHLEFNRQRNYKKAIRKTFFIVGTPLVLTTLIVSSNFGIYVTSDGLSLSHMGLLSVAGMVAALLADLLITPILFRRFKIFGKELESKDINHFEQEAESTIKHKSLTY